MLYVVMAYSGDLVFKKKYLAGGGHGNVSNGIHQEISLRLQTDHMGFTTTLGMLAILIRNIFHSKTPEMPFPLLFEKHSHSAQMLRVRSKLKQKRERNFL